MAGKMSADELLSLLKDQNIYGAINNWAQQFSVKNYFHVV
jgi:hypothetical protein